MGLYQSTQDRLSEVGRLAGLGIEHRHGESVSLAKIRQAVEAADYESAMKLADQLPQNDQSLNIRAVLLMRTGHEVQAANVLRPRVFDTKTGVVRSDASELTIGNLATALFLCGKVAGAKQLLKKIPETAPVAQRLQQAIATWEKRLSWWQWLDWKINGVEHGEEFEMCEPGAFEWDRRNETSAESITTFDSGGDYNMAV